MLSHPPLTAAAALWAVSSPPRTSTDQTQPLEDMGYLTRWNVLLEIHKQTFHGMLQGPKLCHTFAVQNLLYIERPQDSAKLSCLT